MLLTSVRSNLSGSDASVCKVQELPTEACGFCFGPLRHSIRTVEETDSLRFVTIQSGQRRTQPANLSPITSFLNQRKAAISTAYQLWVS